MIQIKLILMIFALGDTLAFRQSELFEIQTKQVEVELFICQSPQSKQTSALYNKILPRTQSRDIHVRPETLCTPQ